MKKDNELILAFGEVTGHKHVLHADVSDVVMEGDVPIEFTLSHEGEITHEEHHTLALPPGSYELSIVQTYDHAEEEARNVID